MSASQQPPVGFDVAILAVRQAEQAGELAVLGQQVGLGLANLTSGLQSLQDDLRNLTRTQTENGALLHELRERSTGLDRLGAAIEKGETIRGTQDGRLSALERQFAHWRGFVVGVTLCGSVALAAVTTFVVYRMDQSDRNYQEVRETIRALHPVGARP